MPSTNQLFRSDGAFVNYRTYILLLFRPYRAKEMDYYPSKYLMRKPYFFYHCSGFARRVISSLMAFRGGFPSKMIR